ncbi:hypothetical protein DR082_03135, partial [Mycoplasma flocculare]|nr:hypothetical protein [Mesomycoplasma flocculare]
KNKKGFSRRKVCEFCESKQEYVDYKNTEVLKKYINATGLDFIVNRFNCRHSIEFIFIRFEDN